METTMQVFRYNDSEITFEIGNGEVMVNATEMSKPFGKRPAEWLRLPSSVKFMEALSDMGKSHIGNIQTLRGGVEGGGGTWMHEDVALEYARWLSPNFAIWCNDRIKELLKYGATFTPNKIEELLTDPDTIIQLATTIKQERLEKDMYRMQSELQSKELKAAAPIVNYANNVLQSKDNYVTDQIAKELGMTAVRLNKLLEKLAVQFRRNGQWLLHSKYADRGFTKTRTYSFTHRDGSQGTSTHTVWTEIGRRFIHEIVDNHRHTNSTAGVGGVFPSGV